MQSQNCVNCGLKPGKFACNKCSTVWYCSHQCRKLYSDDHYQACGKIKAVRRGDSVDNTIKQNQDTPKKKLQPCDYCKLPSKFECNFCKFVAYCSHNCRISNHEKHSVICNQLQVKINQNQDLPAFLNQKNVLPVDQDKKGPTIVGHKKGNSCHDQLLQSIVGQQPQMIQRVQVQKQKSFLLVSPFESDDEDQNLKNQKLKQDFLEFMGQNDLQNIFKQFKNFLIEGANNIDMISKQFFINLEIDADLKIFSIVKSSIPPLRVSNEFKEFIKFNILLEKDFVDIFVQANDLYKNQVSQIDFELLNQFLFSKCYFLFKKGKTDRSNIHALLQGGYEGRRDLWLAEKSSQSENQGSEIVQSFYRRVFQIKQSSKLQMVMNMNLSEYMRTKEIINFLFGCTNSSVKAQNELKNMDFVAIKKLDDNLEDINSKSLYLKSQLSIKEAIESKCNVKIVLKDNENYIVGFKTRVQQAFKQLKTLNKKSSVSIDFKEIPDFQNLGIYDKKIQEFGENNNVEIILKKEEILIEGLEIKDGHLQSIKQNLLILILTLNQDIEKRTIMIPRPELKDNSYQIDNDSNIPLQNILNKKENLEIIMEILKKYNSVMNTKRQNFLDDETDNCYIIQGPKSSIDLAKQELKQFINHCFKRISFYIMEDQLIVNNVLKFEKIYALENDYNCLIIDQENKQKKQVIPESKQYTVQWAYEVFQGDQNFDQKKTYKDVNYIYYDEVHNQQIEKFYINFENQNIQYTQTPRNFSSINQQEPQLDLIKLSEWEYRIINDNPEGNSAKVGSTNYIQINKKTNKKRKMYRFIKQNQPAQQCQINESSKFIIIYGEKERIDDLKQFLNQKYLQSGSDIIKNEIDINEYKFLKQMNVQHLQQIVNQIQNICRNEYQSNISFYNPQVNVKKIIIQSSPSIDVIKMFIRSQFNILEHIQYPSNWNNLIEINEKKLVKYEIQPNEEIYQRIQMNLRSTINNAKIVKVKLIMNYFLWQSFKNGKDQLMSKGVKENVRELWHGTRDSKPSLFYKGEEGFDIKYSNQGMWGKGIYFAENANYSLNYSHKHRNNVRGMFFAMVNLGRVIDLPNDQNIKEPPQGFDSISGFTQGSKVFIVYANKRTYPQYYVKYTTS